MAWDVPCILNQFAASLARAEDAAGVGPRARRYNATGWSFVRMADLADKSWSNWARHRAAVVLPYDPQQIVFYELYGMGLPLLVPSESLLPLMIRLGYTNLRDFARTRPGWTVPADELGCMWTEECLCADIERILDAEVWELRWWSSLTDYARMPHLLRWSSFPELMARLVHTDLPGLSARMRRESNVLLVRSADFWRGALARAMMS
ncbi:unnamed protein product [Prorocentrum cordatum]|uniref:Uncharacterized protein n=1 Tax=Prorocentrum cordatum TaxID=2364126 RepID=A0ABN9Y2U4_9DINO|nr:unnamed protein product [Polarella glacialis]